MSHPIRNMIMLSATALALIAAPVLMNQTALSDLSAIAKDKGNGGGNSEGGGGGEGGGNGGGNGGGGERGNDGGNGNGHGAGGGSESKKSEGKAKKVADTETLTTTAKAAKTKNLNAQLAGLNSLKRNINGLMNSSDPRMELVRDYVEASAALEAATAKLEGAEALLGDLQAALDDFVGSAVTSAALTAFDGSTVYTDPTLQGLNDRLAELDAAISLDPLNQPAVNEQAALTAVLADIAASAEAAAVTEQQGVVDGLGDEIAALEPLTTEEALKVALLAAANKNRVAEAGGEAYLTPEIMAWATARINALTDQLQAQQ